MLGSLASYPQYVASVSANCVGTRGWTGLDPAPIVEPLAGRIQTGPISLSESDIAVLKAIFTWWNGVTIGAWITIKKSSTFVGEDEAGNRYFEARTNKGSYDQRKRRYVIYKGYAEASKISPDWHGWMHYTFDEPPTVEPFKVKSWEKPHVPNLTGTINAWRPKGSIARGGQRPDATGDYQAWKPK